MTWYSTVRFMGGVAAAMGALSIDDVQRKFAGPRFALYSRKSGCS